jgi:hypothetical protein
MARVRAQPLAGRFVVELSVFARAASNPRARIDMAEVCTQSVDTGFVALGYAKIAVLGVVHSLPNGSTLFFLSLIGGSA